MRVEPFSVVAWVISVRAGADVPPCARAATPPAGPAALTGTGSSPVKSTTTCPPCAVATERSVSSAAETAPRSPGPCPRVESSSAEFWLASCVSRSGSQHVSVSSSDIGTRGSNVDANSQGSLSRGAAAGSLCCLLLLRSPACSSAAAAAAAAESSPPRRRVARRASSPRWACCPARAGASLGAQGLFRSRLLLLLMRRLLPDPRVMYKPPHRMVRLSVDTG